MGKGIEMSLVDDLVRDEGLELKPYTDTVGKLTIGIGRNLTDRGISEEEARYLLRNDIKIVQYELRQAKGPWLYDLPDDVRRALLNMAFNMGVPRLMNFKKMWAALEVGDYEEAAAQALDSVWANQVGARAIRIAELIRNG